MSALVADVRAMLERLAGFDASLLSGDECASVVSELARLEKACGAAKARAAARAASCGAHKAAGFADPADWLSRQSGSTTGVAKAALDAAAGLGSCPGTAAALAAGDLSTDQAAEITKTEEARPGSESELLALAHTASLQKLRDRARTLRHQAIGVDELHRRQHAARSFRHWRNELGNIAFAGQLTPEVGVAFANRLELECDRVRRDAKRKARETGEPLEERQAYLADAFARMVSDTGTRRGTSADVVVVIDLRAWRRGHAEAGEPCHVVGGGAVPVDVAKELAGDAFMKAVLHDGVQISTVKHFGRHIPAELRTALELGPLPALDGLECADGCGRRGHLQLDHVDPFANWGPTSFDNLQPRCWGHHAAKTERDRAAGLLDGRAARAGPTSVT